MSDKRDQQSANKPSRAKIGQALSFAGRLALPFGAGLAVGFWTSDRGVPWLPTALAVVLVVFAVGFVALPAGRVLEGRAFRSTEEAFARTSERAKWDIVLP